MEQQKEIKVYQRQSNRIVEKAEDLTIKTEKEIIKATDYLHEIKTAGKKIKELKESYTKPANEIIKRAREMFSPLETQFKKAEMIIKDKMIKYDKEKQLKALKQAEELSKKVEEGEIDIIKASEKLSDITPKTSYQGEEGNIAYRTIKKIRIINERDIPREYLVPNEVLIRKDLLEGKKIKGVELIEEKIIASY